MTLGLDGKSVCDGGEIVSEQWQLKVVSMEALGVEVGGWLHKEEDVV